GWPWAVRPTPRAPVGGKMKFTSGQCNWTMCWPRTLCLLPMDLDSPRSPFDVATLRDGLVGPGMPWRQLDVVAETGSTNADLLARAEGGADIDGSVLLAEYQNAGRGRHGRHWLAPPRTQVALSVGVAGGS